MGKKNLFLTNSIRGIEKELRYMNWNIQELIKAQKESTFRAFLNIGAGIVAILGIVVIILNVIDFVGRFL
ncbi:MAG: hypothetical protein LBM77_11100 [Spirochaetaceae bacterium]|jgi:hypothetical protein|nr:hypothetical protein [Spirochaetaceae bacterium]